MKRFARQEWLDLALLALIAWIARYLLSGHFGLYEDDLSRVPNAITLSLRGMADYFLYMARVYYANRPLHDLLITFFSSLGWHLAGLHGAYLIGFLLWCLNIGLFYALLWRLAGRGLALAGAMAYVVFSADTTQAYLTMALGGQPSLTLLLAAFHAYLSHKAWVSYLLLWVLILFAYETPFLVFLAAPLLEERETIRDGLVAFGKNALILAGLMLSSFLLRYGQGGSVSFELGYAAALKTALLHMIQGPLVSLGTYALRPLQMLQSLDWQGVAVIGLVFGISLFLWLRVPEQEAPAFGRLLGRLRSREAFSLLTPRTRQLLRLILAGLVMLVAAYPITFTTSALAISGRATRGHMAATPGAALILACLILLFLGWLTAPGWRKWANLFLALEIAMMAGFGLVIQRDYVQAWQDQRDFWTPLLPLIDDARPGDVVLVTPENLPKTEQIGGVSWNVNRTLDNLFEFPADVAMEDRPRVYLLRSDWGKHILTSDDRIRLDGGSVTAPTDYYTVVSAPQVILIESSPDGLMRQQQLSMPDGKTLPLKSRTDPYLSRLPPGILFGALINSTQEH